MVVGIKDAAKLLGISIIACCAILVCTMFLNYNMDLLRIEGQIEEGQMMYFYEAQAATAKVVSAISGGCLLVTSIIMLFFYIKHYIDAHKMELGILKALGWPNFKIARHFWVFGSGIFLGGTLGFAGAFLIMPTFYKVQNVDHILPDFTIHFHPALFLYLVVIPTLLFALLAVCYACMKLKTPVLFLLKGFLQSVTKKKKVPAAHKQPERPFLEDMKRETLRSRKSLLFFMMFASFCFSSMTQMSFSMKELASVMMAAMVMMIGLVLACTTLFLAITTVISGNRKAIALLRVTGYSEKECCRALLGGYRLPAWIGFGLGTVYQYVLLKIMVSLVFKDIAGMPEYTFDFPMMFLSLACFVILYEGAMLGCAKRIGKVSLKEIMLE